MCRLAIARALYQNSSILILDEATSALDSMSELLVRQALERVMQDHTVTNKASHLFSSKNKTLLSECLHGFTGNCDCT